MKNIKGAIVATVLVLAIVVALSGCTSQTYSHTATIGGKTFTFNTLKKDTLQIPMDTAYPPFESINATTNKVEGFDIDLMDEICKEMNVTPDYISAAFDSLVTSIQTKKYDVSISAISNYEYRQKQVDFSDSYYENKGQAIMTKVNSTIKGPSDLVGKKVGGEKGTVGLEAAANVSGVNPNDILGYKDMPTSFLALQKGDVEAVAGDYAVIAPFVREHASEYVIAPNFLSETEYFGIIVNKDNKELLGAINAALAKIKADGRYQKIYDKWFNY